MLSPGAIQDTTSSRGMPPGALRQLREMGQPDRLYIAISLMSFLLSEGVFDARFLAGPLARKPARPLIADPAHGRCPDERPGGRADPRGRPDESRAAGDAQGRRGAE